MRNLFISLVMLTVLGLAGTGLAAEPILVGTTTSTADTGLLDYLQPKILKATGLDMSLVRLMVNSSTPLARAQCW